MQGTPGPLDHAPTGPTGADPLRAKSSELLEFYAGLDYTSESGPADVTEYFFRTVDLGFLATADDSNDDSNDDGSADESDDPGNVFTLMALFTVLYELLESIEDIVPGGAARACAIVTERRAYALTDPPSGQ
jgi:hypothetical protein